MAKKGKASDEADDQIQTPTSSFEEGDDALTINMNEVAEGGGFELIPKGEYDAVIEKLDFAMSKSSGRPMWNIMLSITDGEYVGRKLFAIISFSEKALPMAKMQINKIAPELLSDAFNPKKIADEAKLIGTPVSAKVKIEVYEGENRSRVQTLGAPKSGTGEFTN